MPTAPDSQDRTEQRIRALNGRIDELQSQLDDLSSRIGARVLAAAALGLLAVTWLAPDVKGDDVFQGVLADAFHSGFGVLLAPWHDEQSTAALIARIALAAYAVASLALLALPPGKLIHPVLAAVGTLATLAVMLSKPAPFGGDGDPELIYRWTVAPYFAVGVWLVLIVVGFAGRRPSRS